MLRSFAALALTLALLCPALEAGAQGGDRSVLLVARPGMNDPNFREAVVLVTEGEGGQHVGVIINRPTQRSLASILPGERFSRFVEPVFFGGPVALHGLIAVFRAQETYEGTVALLPGLWLALDAATLDALLRKPPASIRFYVGYAGWAPGQLNVEIGRGDWYVLKADPDLLFTRDTAGLWSRLVQVARSVSARAGPPPGRAADAMARTRLMHALGPGFRAGARLLEAELP